MQSLERASGVAREKAVLVRVVLNQDSLQALGGNAQPLAELTGLAETAGAKIVGELTQRREKPDVTTYLGRGKVNELKALVAQLDADVAIFDNDLNPAQIRNLEQEIEVKVLDRTELILDIFATNARSYESRLAVELAQLEYSLPRLKRMWTHLSRIKAGIGMRGPGEKQLEVDRRLVEKRIHDLREELHGIERRKERLVASRHDRLTVSLVGYTNAGKSTLMNTLTGAGVLAADKLFATLDTRTRRWQLDNWGPVLLSDTVGFIRDLPHGLVHSFKATLEEARQADLLLHVADASNPEVLEQISAVYKVLQELHIEEKDTLLVLNKVDRLADHGDLARIFARYPNAVPISAATGDGLRRLQHEVSEALSRSFADLDIEAPVTNGKLLAFLAAHGEVLERKYLGDDRVLIHCRIPQRHTGGLRQEGVTTRPHQAVLAEGAEDGAMRLPLTDAIEEVAQLMARRKIAGLRVLLTGASSGIGRELAIQLVREGASVLALARRGDRLQQLAEEIAQPERFAIHVADVTHADDRKLALKAMKERFGGLDVLINNAGSGAIGPFVASSEERLRQVMEVNFFAAVELIRLTLPLLKQGHKPIVVNVSSVLGHRAVPQKSEYCASKFALHGFSDALRAEVANDKIDVLLVSPSTTQTEFFDRVQGDTHKPHGRFGAKSPAYVARATLRAIRAGRHEVILSTGGRLLVWLDRICPALADRLVAWWG